MFLKNITRKGNLNYMGQKINFYGVVVSIWTNGFLGKWTIRERRRLKTTFVS